MQDLFDKNEVVINTTVTTMENCYDIILENEDYTIGNILNYILYTIFYRDTKFLSYCGFKKMHPHDSYSIIRIAFTNPAENKTKINDIFKIAIDKSLDVFNKMKELVERSYKKNR